MNVGKSEIFTPETTFALFLWSELSPREWFGQLQRVGKGHINHFSQALWLVQEID
jgi:hypothetical protein